MKMNPIRKFFDVLFDYYGPQKWWPCQSGARWEIITGAILTQNTAWTNVEKAIGNLLTAGLMSPEKVLKTSDMELQELIRPAGFFKQKCAYLKAMAAFLLEREVEFEQSCHIFFVFHLLCARPSRTSSRARLIRVFTVFTGTLVNLAISS